MKRLLSAVFLLLFSVSAFSQSGVVRNFDKRLTPTDNEVLMAPPVGMTWRFTLGSFIIRRPIQGAGITVCEQGPNPPLDRTNIIRADLGETPWIPIVGGYVSHPYWGYLKGQENAIVVSHPNSLVITIEGLRGPTDTFTRFTIEEFRTP